MSNTGITLTDVRNEAFEAIQKLKDKQMDVQTAKEIRGMLDVVVNTARTQVDFLNAIPDDVKKQLNATEVKAIAGTLRDRDAELDMTLHDIDHKRNNITLK